LGGKTPQYPLKRKLGGPAELIWKFRGGEKLLSMLGYESWNIQPIA
jgi:hypothetical protein